MVYLNYSGLILDVKEEIPLLFVYSLHKSIIVINVQLNRVPSGVITVKHK